MKKRNSLCSSPIRLLLSLIFVGLTATGSFAVTYYVDASRPDDSGDGLSWATAKHTIQAAVDVAGGSEALIRVAPGIYCDGGRRNSGAVISLTNRVCASGPITIRSEGGAGVTTIEGAPEEDYSGSIPLGDSAVRGVCLADGAVLIGFTVSNGFTHSNKWSNSGHGGGILSDEGCVISNCIITGCGAVKGGGVCGGTLYNCKLIGNESEIYGGGAYDGELRGCVLRGNQAAMGGGASSANLIHCTLLANVASSDGGGVYKSALENCIVMGNESEELEKNYRDSTLEYCCTCPLPESGAGNICSDPCLADNVHLSAGSPCRSAGNAICSVGTDIDGEAWMDSPSIGCDQYMSLSATGQLSVSLTSEYTRVAIGFGLAFEADIQGHAISNVWDFDDGDTCADSLFVNHDWAVPGVYDVTLTAYNVDHPDGVCVTQMVVVVTAGESTHYVSLSSASPATPFSTWETAAHTIQDAVDAVCVPGALIRVADGTYNVGSRVTPGFSLSNRVCAVGPMTIRSESGPEHTIIEGAADPADYYEHASIRGVYLAEGAHLSGFTVMNGHTHNDGYIPGYTSGVYIPDICGGGVYADGLSSVSNCILMSNTARYKGGGLYRGTANNCDFSGCSAMLGGGAANAALWNCVMHSNSASGYPVIDFINQRLNYSGGGGAAYGSSAVGCLMTGNEGLSGGAVDSCVLHHCSLHGNHGESYGGAYDSSAYNSIIYGNSSNSREPSYDNYRSATSFYYCCTWPMSTSGVGNIVADPGFMDDYHLSSSSPCIGAGSSAYAMGTDLDGNAWFDPPSIGCDQYSAASATGSLSVAVNTEYTNIAIGYETGFRGSVDGRALSNVWAFGDGTYMADTINASHRWDAAGTYQVTFTAFNQDYPEGISTQQVIVVAAEDECVRYVSQHGAPTPPYSSWDTAARTIQQAVDASSIRGTIIHVSNGCYNAGAVAAPGQTAKNRLFVNGPFVVRSVNGPKVTVIEGAPDLMGGTPSNGAEAVRGVYLSSGAELIGFTVTNGYTQTGDVDNNDGLGAGIFCDGACVISNCVISGNTAYRSGGGVFGEDAVICNSMISENTCHSNSGGVAYGTLHNCRVLNNAAAGDGGGTYESEAYGCFLSENQAQGDGGGAYGGALFNCTILDNAATGSGGGACQSSLRNSIIHDNHASSSPDVGGAYSYTRYCCFTAADSYDRTRYNCISNAPSFMYGTYLNADSPCIDGGSSVYCVGTDLDGDPWLDPPSIGCEQFLSSGATGELHVAISTTLTSNAYDCVFSFSGEITGRILSNRWSFGDGTVILNQSPVTHVWSETGTYDVVFTAYNADYPYGVSVTQTVTIGQHSTTHYVSTNSLSPAHPYSSWETAAHTIQDALDAVQYPHAVVLVDDGCYSVGAQRVADHRLYSRACLTDGVVVQSVNGPEVTFIEGMADTNSSALGVSAIRGVYMDRETMLVGFTIRGGYTWKETTDGNPWGNPCDCSGGGIYCEDDTSVISNCVIMGNQSRYNGGGVFQGALYNSVIVSNEVYYGGGGAYSSVLHNCTLEDNAVYYHGGGAFGCELNGCLLKDNYSSHDGGGVAEGSLNNCTLVGNTAVSSGGGAYLASLNNCILWSNICVGGAAETANYSGGTLNYCCAYPQSAGGVGNIDVDPSFADGYHLSADSLCVGAGSADYSRDRDIDGDAWLFPPSIGCDEQPALGVSVTIHASADSVAAGEPVVFSAEVSGVVLSNRWDYMSGNRVAVNTLVITNSSMVTGVHQVAFTVYTEAYPAGVSFSGNMTVVPGTLYVWKDSPAPEYPYTSWETAAHSIQRAVDATAHCEARVLVREGVHDNNIFRNFIHVIDPGPHCTSVYEYYCLVVDGPITIESESGPKATVIMANPDSASGDIGGIVLQNGAKLIGFTMMNARTGSGSSYRVSYSSYGRGISASYGSVVSNCIVKNNDENGISNLGTVYNTMIVSNSGGGAFGGTYYSCLMADNTGTGVRAATLRNCTVSGNHSTDDVGGVIDSDMWNCIVWGNTSLTSPAAANYRGGTLNCCCADPMPTSGLENVSSDPIFVDATSGDYRLQAGSPCYNTGAYWPIMSYATNDLAGNSRSLFGDVDMGAYERTYEAYAIYVNAGPNGTVNPAGNVIPVSAGGNVSLTFTANDWFEMGDVLVNGSSAGPLSQYAWTNVTANGTVDVSFAETYVAGCPCSLPRHWLAQYGLTTNMAEAAHLDQDNDGVNAWQEYLMDTSPIDASSLLAAEVEGRIDHGYHGYWMEWMASSNREYTVYVSTNLVEGFTDISSSKRRPAQDGVMDWYLGSGARDIYFKVKAVVP